MTTMVDEDHCATYSSSDDSFEYIKEVESNLYSILHYNNLSEFDASNLPEGYNISINDSSNDVVVTLQDGGSDLINSQDPQHITERIDVNKTSEIGSSKPLSPDQSNKQKDIECINLINSSDSDIDVVQCNEDESSKKDNIAINAFPAPSKVIVCSSSEDDNAGYGMKAPNSSATKRKREKSKLKKSKQFLKSQCPKKWTPSMVKFYNKMSSKRLNFDSSKLIKKMRESGAEWKLCNREFERSPSKGRCLRCRQHGHVAKNCTEPYKVCVCHFCGGLGHNEKKCRNTICLSCGSEKKTFIQRCKRCCTDFTKGNLHCTICKSHCHNTSYCPDLWRAYHLTTNDDSTLVVPLRSTLQRLCSYCKRSGHFECDCRAVTNSAYILESPEIQDYFAVAQACTTDKKLTVILKLEDEDSAALVSEKGCEFLQGVSNSTQARIELDDDPVALTVVGSASQCRAVKDLVVSYLGESSFHKHKTKSNASKKRKTM